MLWHDRYVNGHLSVILVFAPQSVMQHESCKLSALKLLCCNTNNKDIAIWSSSGWHMDCDALKNVRQQRTDQIVLSHKERLIFTVKLAVNELDSRWSNANMPMLFVHMKASGVESNIIFYPIWLSLYKQKQLKQILFYVSQKIKSHSNTVE